MSYNNIAWMGGSYSPPTRMHVTVALEMGKALSKLGGKSAVCIVPVSGKYKKGSVRDECITQENRWALAEAFLSAIKSESDGSVDYLLMDYEFKAAAAVPTINSLEILKSQEFCSPETNIYIAQGRDNIEGIFSRSWVRSDELIRTYKFFMFPRGDKPYTTEQMMTTLTTDNEKQKFPPISAEEAYGIANGVILVGENFNDDTSSSKVRALIREGGAIDEFIHPLVLSVLKGIPDAYTNGSCEVTPASGGMRKTKGKNRKTKGKNRKAKRRTKGKK